jgi:hypothetical protein
MYFRERGYSMGRACWIVVAAIWAVVLLLALAGCGGGSDEPTLTKKQYVRQGNRICRHGYKRQARWVEAFDKAHGFNYGEPNKHEREVTNTVIALKVEREKIQELEALPVPEGDEARLRKIFKAMEEGIRQSEKHPDYLAEPTPAHPEPFQEARDLATAYGIWICGQA